MPIQLPVLGTTLAALIAAAILSLIATPVVRSLAFRVGAVDIPKDARRMHSHPIPRMGGLAIFLGFLLSVLVFLPLDEHLRGMLLGSVIIVILGIFDDIYALPAKPGVANLMSIYSAITGKSYAEIEAEFTGCGYGKFKPTVGDAVVECLRPIREEATRILADKAYLENVYKAGAEKASYVANKTLRKVYKKIGFVAR